MNGTQHEDVFNGKEQPMEDAPSPLSPTTSEDTLSSDSSKDDLIAVEDHQLSAFLVRPDVEILDNYKPTNIKRNLREDFMLPERVYSESKSGARYSAFLETADLWKQFDDIGTEMIVTRRGRRMFPPLKMQLLDLDPKKCYVMLMDISPCDEYRYKFQNSSWQQCFKEDCSATRYYIHPDSPALGTHWMKSIISFYKLKLTNNQLDKLGNIIVSSMHKYQPRLHIVEASCTDVEILRHKEFHTIIFPGTQFMTVTAYQNDKITQLKINNNPFAKGFRHPFARVRPRSRYTDLRNSSTGSDSSADEGNTLSVIHTGPGFARTTKEQGVLQRNGFDTHRHISFSPPSTDTNTKNNPSSVTHTTPFPTLSKDSSSITTFHTPALSKPSKQIISNGTPFHALNKPSPSPSEDSPKANTRAVPSPTQALPFPTMLHTNLPVHPIINSSLPPVPNGTTLTNGIPAVHTSPTLVNGHTVVQGQQIVINGMKYFLIVPSNGTPPSLFPMSSIPGVPIVNSGAVYTSAPVQLLSTTPTNTKPAFQLPKEHLSPNLCSLTKPTPPPLLSIGSLDSPPPSPITTNTKLVKMPQSEATERPQDGLVYLQSTPTPYQKLLILPVMTNSRSPNGTVLMPLDKTIPLSPVAKNENHEQLTTTVPIYRFGSNNEG